ncbi:ankyrin repeat domain-containing protein [Tropicibacter oceani]|uniref:Ankyrin repeat domain-containing protein n=1 Tax=Tropicibacter oceani TaxID=3058420 RepID=A0ABY8QLL4_9RHOB|nr:ankyrin repeat domain-containing protein [Tropicibacter oceani]WGW05524.1 ankyrin repeat domain-containing protein [Tropicibacter oceani]
MSDLSLDTLRHAAKRLHHAHDAREPWALERLKQRPPRKGGQALVRADFLHVVALEHGFESWPRLKHAAETTGLDRAVKQQRLKIALFHGQNAAVQALLADTPGLADGLFGLQCALYDRAAVKAALARDPGLAVQRFGPRSAILHLAFSRWIKARPDLEPDMLAVAELLLAHGADVNDGYPFQPGDDHLLSALYGAIGHADNMVLGGWLLDHGANPNDGEALYHATELGHHEGLKMLLAAGADPRGTNALLRAMDFHDHVAVQMLLDHGARADDFNAKEVGGEAPYVMPALHQAARRGSDARMIEILLAAGADPAVRYKGASAYGFAKVHGNTALIRAIEARGVQVDLSPEETLMARAAEGLDSPGQYIDPAKLPEAYRHLIREILHLPGRLPQIRALVALGLPYDQPDAQGVTPVQIAGWEGLPEVMAYFLKLRPDLSHVNGYGGTLLSTILHGADNNPDRAGRDYVGCLRLALDAGVALPSSALRASGRKDVTDFLQDWAGARPGQVV